MQGCLFPLAQFVMLLPAPPLRVEEGPDVLCFAGSLLHMALVS